MSKARDLANAGTALTTVSATELGYLDGVTSAVQTQIDSKIGQSTAINPSTVTTKGDILVATGSGTIVRQGVGTDGQVLVADSAQADGVNWVTPASGAVGLTLKRASIDAISWRDIATNGSNIWVIVGAAGSISSSTDGGATWTSRTSNLGANDINVVTYGLGIFVAGGAAGTITTSTDGITWTARTANVGTNSVISISLANNIFFAGAAGATTSMSTSTDGITWTGRAGATEIYGVKQVAFGNGYYVAAGQNEGNGGIMYSTNLSTWTSTNILSTFIYVVFNNNQFIVYNTSGPTNGRYTGNNPTTGWTTFTPVNMGSTLNHKTIDYYNGSLYYYATSSSGTPYQIIGRQKPQINTALGSVQEVYQNYFNTLPVDIQGLTSKGDGTFGMITSAGMVYFAS
jgi:hypothetical protein